LRDRFGNGLVDYGGWRRAYRFGRRWFRKRFRRRFWSGLRRARRLHNIGSGRCNSPLDFQLAHALLESILPLEEPQDRF
jgi:hypothetical protein